MAETNALTIKFLKPIAIGHPTLGTIAPNLYATTKVVNGFASPVPVQDYNFDEEYEVKLLPETPEKLPSHFEGLDETVKTQFQTQQATALAQNHNLNNVTRQAMRKYEDEGIIKVTHDTFVDGPKKSSQDEGPGEWKLQDANTGKRLDEDSLDVKNDREKRLSDPNPHVPRQAVGSDANYQATAERNAEFGDHEGVPTTENPKPKTLKQQAEAKKAKNPTSTEEKAGKTAIASSQNTVGGDATPTKANESDKA